jgi:FtsZ-binding cell division protein ZapB
MESDDLEKRVEQAVDEMRSHVEELEQRRDALEQRTEEARRESHRLDEASPGTKALGDEDEDEDNDEDGGKDEDAAEGTSPKDG